MLQPLTIMIVIVTVTIAAVVGVLLNFRFLLYPLIPSLNPTAHTEHIKLDGNTLFISDLHLKPEQPFEYANDLRHFIETRQVSNLVVNGDLFNSPEDARKALENPSDLIAKLGLDNPSLKLFWVKGSPAHDPPNLSAPRSNLGGLRVLGRCVLLDFGHVQVMAYHGHDMSLKGALGHAWDRFISKLSLERLWKRMARVNENLWVFFGHTHIPGVDLRHRVANSGGWQKVIFVTPTRTGLLISDKHNAPEIVIIA
jgi:UDP-2,3-diacylglucosamine pyrophosphatase LpxH